MPSAARSAAVGRLLDVAAKDDAPAAIGQVLALRSSGVTVEDIVDGLLAPALKEIGSRWERNEYSVADEHRATAVVDATLGALVASALVPTSNGRVMVLCADTEWHTLPARLLQAKLISHGWDVTHLGTGGPSSLSSLEPDGTVAALVSCTISASLPGAVRTIQRVHEMGLPVLLGGAALAGRPANALRLGADAEVDGFGGLLAVLAGWRDVGGPRLRDALVAEGFTAYEQRLPEIEAAVRQGLADQGIALPERIAANDPVRLTLRFVGAALLLDDPSVLTEALRWIGRVLQHRGIARESILMVVDVLEGWSDSVPALRRLAAQVRRDLDTNPAAG